MSKRKFFHTAIYFAIVMAMILLSYLWPRYSRGLAFYEGEGKELSYLLEDFNSHTNEGVVIEIGFYIFLIPLIWKLLRISKFVARSDCYLFGAAWIIQFLFLYSLSMELGPMTLYDTVIYGRDYILASWLFVFCLSIAVIAYIYLQDRKIHNVSAA